MKTFRNVPVFEIDWVKDLTSDGEYPELFGYISDSAQNFLAQWIPNTFDLDEVKESEIEGSVWEPVHDKIRESAERHLLQMNLGAIERATSYALEFANVPFDIEINEKKAALNISVNRNAVERAWQRATDGVGLVAWDPSLNANDIGGGLNLISILDSYLRVYGMKSMERVYSENLPHAEPDTGRYSDLAAVAQKAWRSHLREKHKAGTKHRPSR
jgi:hypothetical protein